MRARVEIARRCRHVGSVNLDADALALRHLWVGLDDGRAVGSAAPMLRGSFVNAGTIDDELLPVTLPAADTVRLAGPGVVPSQTVALVAGAVVRLEHPQDPGWLLEPVSCDLAAGTSVSATFHFAHQRRVTATVPVAVG